MLHSSSYNRISSSEFKHLPCHEIALLLLPEVCPALPGSRWLRDESTSPWPKECTCSQHLSFWWFLWKNPNSARVLTFYSTSFLTTVPLLASLKLKGDLHSLPWRTSTVSCPYWPVSHRLNETWLDPGSLSGATEIYDLCSQHILKCRKRPLLMHLMINQHSTYYLTH